MRRFTYDWSQDIRSGNRPLQQYLGFTAGRWLWSSIKGRQPDCKIQQGRNVVRDWCMSRVTAIISALVICIIVCLSWAVNHYRDNAITYKAQRDKNAGELAGERGNYWHADASAWCCCARCKIHEGALTLKLKMMLCVMMLLLVVVGCTLKQFVSQCVKPPLRLRRG